MIRLTDATASYLPTATLLPGYNRHNHKTGIVHFGPGVFFRSHLACYTDQALAKAGGDWRICAVSLCSPSLGQTLAAQDFLYTVIEQSAAAPRYRLIGSIDKALFAPDDRARVDAHLDDPITRIVSLTITEKGYCHDPATGRLNEADPAIQHDIANPDCPKTAVGYLTYALARRRKRGSAPFTLLSCDNLPDNGHLLRSVLVDFARLVNKHLADWIANEVTFPCTMVDRIVPTPTEADKQAAAEKLGVFDDAVTLTEPFTQWILEDRFPLGRPYWEAEGAIFTSDVKPFELMKLRLLNGAHSLLAYLGILAGMTTVSACMQWPPLKKLCESFMRDEVLPTLHISGNFPVHRYIDLLLERFDNRALRHELKKIATDGSQKLPPRWLDTVRLRLERGQSVMLLALAVAAWIRYICGVDERGTPLLPSDPLISQLAPQVVNFRQKPEETVMNILKMKQIFGDDLHQHQGFCDAVKTSFSHICKSGSRAAISDLAGSAPR